MTREAVGIDVGGTKIAGAVVAEDGTLSGWQVEPAQALDPDATAKTIGDMAAALWHDGLEGVGVGAAGLVDYRAGTVRYAPNLRYRELAIGQLIRDRIGKDVKVAVDNDANVAAWGEFCIGAGKGSSHMVLVTVGTGIGGGVVIDGRLFRGANGMGAEIGHMSIDPNGPYCGCGRQGCWERLASGTALAFMGREAVLGLPGSTILALAGDEHQVTGRHVTEAAAQGDELAGELIHRLGINLGRGLVNLANIFDPDLFVIGGGLVTVGDPLLGPAQEELHRGLEGASHRPPIRVVSAQLGEKAGVVGAALELLDTGGR